MSNYQVDSTEGHMVSQDEAFSRAMNAMYWGGYWTAMYHVRAVVHIIFSLPLTLIDSISDTCLSVVQLRTMKRLMQVNLKETMRVNLFRPNCRHCGKGGL